jgi:hypothetical protein
VDNSNHTFSLSPLSVSTVSVAGIDLTQVVFKLPTGAVPGTCTITLVHHGHVSNSATFRIVP